MTSRRAFLASCTGAALFSASSRGESHEAASDRTRLGAVAERKGVLFGCATSNYQIADASFAEALAQDARILVAEYEMKRKALESERGTFDFSASDALLAYARRHDMQLRGHTLCWHAANPPWLADAVESTRDESLLTGYIARVAGRYSGRIHSWDVVNEALLPQGGRSDALRDTLWLRAFGPSYVDLAFHAARAADPKALLVYNDWGCEAGPNDRFRSATLEFLNGALSRGVPIGALGLQGHLTAFGPAVDQSKLRKFLDEVKAMGLKLLVTELDVDDHGGPDDVAARDRAAADSARRFIDVILDAGAVAALTWGLTDRFLDPVPLSEQFLGREPRKLPLDADLRRKPMWWALEQAFSA
jgi:endo-1,4-beta-xylanase